MKTLPDDVREFFRKKGSKGGKIGGKRAAENMTPEQRCERARNATKGRTPEQEEERRRKISETKKRNSTKNNP